MQTFVPYGSDFEMNAKCLDRQRLGKQRVEAWQILNALQGLSKGWINHPAVRMWRCHTDSLARYGVAVCKEWIERGYKDSMLERFSPYLSSGSDGPEWLERVDVILSHRSNLVRKLPKHYSRLWPSVPANLPYIWPLGDLSDASESKSTSQTVAPL